MADGRIWIYQGRDLRERNAKERTEPLMKTAKLGLFEQRAAADRLTVFEFMDLPI